MNDLPERGSSRELSELRAEEGRLEELTCEMDRRASGLVDIDLILALARVKLRLALLLVSAAGRTASDSASEDLRVAAGRHAAEALRLIDGLVSQTISEDQRGVIQASPLFSQVRTLFEQFIVSGGGEFLTSRELDARKGRILSRVVATAIRTHMGVDDRYPPLDVERFSPFMRKLLLALFPIFIRLRPQKPPYGIEEGEEEIYRSASMRLPLSQAIHYMENELLPGLELKLQESPGDSALQQQISSVRDKLARYKSLRVTPRSTPVLLEKGFHTEGMTGFTADGELLVSIPVAVSMRSGTNLDRKMELVRMDVVRRIAGRGVSAEIDQEYRRLRSIESGIRGSSRTPSFKLDAAWGTWALRQKFPFIARLTDKKAFQELARAVQSGSLGAARRAVAELIATDQEKISSISQKSLSEKTLEALFLGPADRTDSRGLGPGAQIPADPASPDRKPE